MLAGLVGGKVYQQHARWQRRCYLLVLLYLLALLAVVILPEIAPRREVVPEVRSAAEFFLPLIFILIALVPAEPDPPEQAQIIDFFYSVFLMLLLGVVILGSFALMTVRQTEYLEALTYTVFMTAGAVLLVGLAWNPRGGFSGLNVFFVRYLFSIGLPVERWLHFLAELAQLEPRPDRFLVEGLSALRRLPSVAGVRWRAGDAQGEQGEVTPSSLEFQNSALSLTVYSRFRMSPALHWHLHLLGQLLGEFYIAKLREEQLRQQSYLQAVHETGARMTHDIKNLLQSLSVLCSVAADERNRDSRELQALVRRQLPAITQRLAATLEKLQRPQDESESFVSAQAWWDALARQYKSESVEFERDAIAPGAARAAFAVRQRRRQPAAQRARQALAEPRYGSRSRSPSIGEARRAAVKDSGRGRAPTPLANACCAARWSSARGLGIGLYQAARQAEAPATR